MRLRYFAALAATGLMAGTAVAGQTTDSGDVNSYLCTFAGKCGGAESADAAVTKAAPATKGFHLASSQTAQPTMAVPAVKGFRIASSTKPATTTTTPSTGRFSLAKPVTRPAMPRAAAVSSGTRANLMLAFEYNSAQMTPVAEAKAKTFAQALMMTELKDKRFLIEGHTDARGSRDANIDLSRRRAQSVADFLVTQGVERSRVEVKGVGPDAPLPGHSAASEANRRVEAVLLS